MTKLLGLSLTPTDGHKHQTPFRGAPRLQPGWEHGQAESVMGSGGVLVLGEGAAASRREQAFPSHALSEEALGPGPGPPPSPARSSGKSQSPHTGTHTQAQGRAQRRAAPTANCYGNPGVRFHSPPRRSPPLPELQPTGLCASQERAIKSALWRWPRRARPGAGRARPISDLEKAYESMESLNMQGAQARAQSAQAVPLPGFPAPPSPGTGEWRTHQVPLDTF